jgi:CHAT domain-containing protein/tetratricopeptide (TPR) repeat protein
MYLKRFLFLFFLTITSITLSNGMNADSLKYNDTLDKALSLYRKGRVYGQNGILDSALLHTQKAVLFFEGMQPTDSTHLANAYQSLGIINKLLGKYNDAINCYDKSEGIYISINNTQLTAYIYGNKANIYSAQQDYSKALDYLLRANDIFKNDSIKFQNQRAITYNNLGNIYRKKEDYVEAINYYNKSLSLKTKNNSLYSTLGNLALCYNMLEKPELANTYYLKAIKIIRELYGENNTNATTQYLNYANFLAKEKNNDKALKFYRSTINIYRNNIGEKHPDLSNCYNDLGEFFLKENKIDSALFYFQKSLIALSPNFNDEKISSNPTINQALSKIRLLSALKNKAYALSELYLLNNDKNYLKLSLVNYDQAIETIDLIRSGYISEESKLFLAANESETFSNALQTSFKLYKLTQEQKYLEKAFNYSEYGKSAILNESLKNNHALNIGGIPDSLIIKEKQLRKSIWNYEELIYEENKNKKPDHNKLKYWNEYLFNQKQEFDKLSVYLENNFQKYQSLKNKKNTVSIAEVQKKISRNEVLIEFCNTENKIFTFVISKKISEIYVQDIDSVFHNHLDNLLHSLSDNNFSYHGIHEFNQFKESSFYVYKYLVKPIEDKIKNKDLIIIPSEKLTYLPFEVLITEKDDYTRIDYKALPYLLYNNSINYFYSASLLFEKNTIYKTTDKKLGAFAPMYNNANEIYLNTFSYRQEYREKLFPLPGIKEEIQAISELLNSGDMYMDNRATEKIFKEVAPRYDILHLAMHTIMDDENPMYSKMAFTQNNDSIEDGFLNTYELYNMKLNSRMTVLSSCNSGSGKYQRGEGVMSLARGFVYAGCPSIVMTLWSVEDKSGVKLMTSFYKYLMKGKTKSRSLQLSKIDFINNADQLKSHPYFWSGYVVIGNNDGLFLPYKKYLIFFGIFMIAGIVLFYRFRKPN